MWRTKCTVEDLPLVPVTAAMVAGCRPAKVAAISATRRRGLASRTTTMRGIERRQHGVGARRGSPPRRASPRRRRTPRRRRRSRRGLRTGSRAGPCGSRASGRREQDRAAGRQGRGGVGARPHELTQPQRDALPLRPPPSVRRRAPAAPCARLRPRWRASPARTAAAPAGAGIGVEAISSGGWPCSSRPAGCRRATRCLR